jgi:hypothetical protein
MEERNTHINLRFVEHEETPPSLVEDTMEDLIEDHLREPTKKSIVSMARGAAFTRGTGSTGQDASPQG